MHSEKFKMNGNGNSILSENIYDFELRKKLKAIVQVNIVHKKHIPDTIMNVCENMLIYLALLLNSNFGDRGLEDNTLGS